MGISLSGINAALQQALAPIKRRLNLVVTRGRITNVDDSKKMQACQVGIYKDDAQDGLERFQEYGFTSVPQNDAEAAIIFLGGQRDHGIIIAVDDRRYRVKELDRGEVAIYTDEGDKIHLQRGNKIEITTGELTVNASSKIEMTAPVINLKATVINLDQV